MLINLLSGLFGGSPKPSQVDTVKHTTKGYKDAVERALKHEGGYSDHPADKGGKTNFGITEAVARQHGYKGDMRALSRDFAIDVYKKSYWDKVRAGEFQFAVGFQLFDACINHGQRNAIKIAQRAVGVKDDGIIGPVTIQAIQDIDPSVFIVCFNAERIKFYTSLSTWGSFGRGWARRVADNLDYAAEDLSDD